MGGVTGSSGSEWGNDIVIPIHTLGEIGRSITSDALYIAESLEDQ